MHVAAATSAKERYLVGHVHYMNRTFSRKPHLVSQQRCENVRESQEVGRVVRMQILI